MDDIEKMEMLTPMDPGIVEVDGKQVFTANWTLTQMQAHSCSIDRANTVSFVSIALSIMEAAAIVWLLIR